MVRPGNVSGSFDVQRVETEISGRLGEWLPVGGTSGSGYETGAGVGYSASTQNRQDRSIYLKVEEIH